MNDDIFEDECTRINREDRELCSRSVFNGPSKYYSEEFCQQAEENFGKNWRSILAGIGDQ